MRVRRDGERSGRDRVKREGGAVRRDGERSGRDRVKREICGEWGYILVSCAHSNTSSQYLGL